MLSKSVLCHSLMWHSDSLLPVNSWPLSKRIWFPVLQLLPGFILGVSHWFHPTFHLIIQLSKIKRSLVKYRLSSSFAKLSPPDTNTMKWWSNVTGEGNNRLQNPETRLGMFTTATQLSFACNDNTILIGQPISVSTNSIFVWIIGTYLHGFEKLILPDIN